MHRSIQGHVGICKSKQQEPVAMQNMKKTGKLGPTVGEASCMTPYKQ